MDDNYELTIKLAGLTLAHAAWSVSNGETLCTLALVEKGDEHELYRFEADSIPESVEAARQKLKELAADRWALAYDGYITLNDERRDALIIQLPEAPQLPARIIQKYKPVKFMRGFKIVGSPLLVESDGSLIENDQVQAWLAEGVEQHSKVAQLWRKWFQSV
jgi:hypothetical protein